MDHLDLAGIEAVIFDLGGVIVDIDYRKTFEKFQFLSSRRFHDLDSIIMSEPIFRKYEIGAISEAHFFEGVKRILGTSASQNDLADAWNSMILQIPSDRLELIRELRNHFGLFVFSNTNTTHIRYVNNILRAEEGINSFSDLFKQVFYSHELGARKPDVEAFQRVLERIGVSADKILFIDDNFDNVQNAKLAGINGWHINDPIEWMEFFKKWN